MWDDRKYESAEEKRRDDIKYGVLSLIMIVGFWFALLAWFMCWI